LLAMELPVVGERSPTLQAATDPRPTPLPSPLECGAGSILIRVGDSAIALNADNLLDGTAQVICALILPLSFDLKHLLSVLGIMGALIILAALAWGVSLRRRIRQQTAIIREWLRREAALKKQYFDLFESANDAILILEPEQKIILEANAQACRTYGFTKKELVGMSLKRLIKDVSRGELQIAKLLHDGSCKNFETVHTRSDGREIEVLASASVIDYNGRTAILTINHDITERQQAEEELKFRNVLLATQQEASLDGILVVDENAKVISFNQRYVQMWGIPPEVIEPGSDERTIQVVLDKVEDPEPFLKRVNHLYEHREEISREEIALRDGRTFDRYSAPMFGSEGRCYGRVWYFRDITARKQAEEAVRASEDRYRDLFENANDIIYTVDLDGNLTGLNRATERITGYPRAEALRMNLAQLIVPEQAERALRGLNLAREGGAPPTAEWTIITKDGRRVLLEVTFRVITEGGKPVGIQGIARDITERKRAEDRIRESQRFLEGLLKAIPIRVFWKDRDLNYLGCNALFALDAGIDRPGDIIGKDDYQLGWRDQADS
jgi:PAS domain S-box-containing protein